MRRRPRAIGATVLPALALALAAPLAAPGAPAVATTPTVRADGVRDAQYWLDDNGIREAWATTRGAGVTIAVIDSGIARGVPDLAGAVVGGADFSGAGAPDGQTPVGDDAPHGTLVAALAAGRGTAPDTGVIGAAPEASLLSLSIGFGAGSDDDIAEAVRWAVDRGADVINMSLTRNTLEWPKSWDDAFLYAAEHDVVVVAAAGNRAGGTTRVGAPATMPGVLTVAGLARGGAASFDASSQGITIGVAAPSEQLIGVRPDGRYVGWAGTSGATPIVSGVVALVRAAHPELDAANVIQRVLATARDAGPPGPDFSYGHGVLDAAAAIGAEVPLVDANPLGDLREWIRVHRRTDAGALEPIDIRDRTASPPVAASDEPVEALPEWVPGIVELRLVVLPWAVAGGLGLVLVALAGGLLTHFRSSRAKD